MVVRDPFPSCSTPAFKLLRQAEVWKNTSGMGREGSFRCRTPGNLDENGHFMPLSEAFSIIFNSFSINIEVFQQRFAQETRFRRAVGPGALLPYQQGCKDLPRGATRPAHGCGERRPDEVRMGLIDVLRGVFEVNMNKNRLLTAFLEVKIGVPWRFEVF